MTLQRTQLLTNTIIALKPPEKLIPSKWVNAYHVLPSTANEPGKYNTQRTPFVSEILDCAIDPTVEEIIVMKSAQCGISECGLALLNYFIAVDPSSILYVLPTVQSATDFSKDRFFPLTQESSAIKDKIDLSPRSGNTVLRKSFPGGYIVFTGANSPTGLASKPIKRLIMDEVDKFELDIKKAGCPIELAKARTTTFGNRRVYLISTPTVKGYSRIAQAFEETDKRFFMIPCPTCLTKQRLVFENIKYENDDPHTAILTCPHCQHPFSDLERWKGLALGVWEPTVVVNNKKRGYHLSSLYSPWRTIKDIVQKYLEAKKGGEAQLKQFVNEWLGEVFDENTQRSNNIVLQKRAESYSVHVIPEQVLMIVAGVDCQDDRLEMTCIGFGLKDEAWVLEHVVIQGNPSESIVWNQLEALLQKQYIKSDKSVLFITATCVDSGGHKTAEVYSFAQAQQKKNRKVMAIKGRGGSLQIWDSRNRRSTKHKKMIFHIVGVDTAKSMVFSRLRLDPPGENTIHFPSNLPESYYRGLVAEYPKWEIVRGTPIKRWIKDEKETNEPWDCMIYCYCALESQRPLYDKLQNDYILACKPPEPQTQKSNYLNKHKYS
jgi:phage terminase large subunit GpA-like protein